MVGTNQLEGPRTVNVGDEVAVVGDVHGCGTSLARLLDRLDRTSPRARVILVGDLLTKGPTPERVVRLVRERRRGGPIESVCGNHDRRMLAALLAMEQGASLEELPGHERRCWVRLAAHGELASAREILCDAVRRVTIEGPARAWTVLHAGIDPRLGLDRSSDEVKWSIKARPGETAWWEQYGGQDGLLVFGHKPLDAPLRRTIDRAPVAVNVDTGCVEGGPLTAYLVHADRFLSVESEVLSVSRVASVPRSASGVRSRSFAGSS